MVSLSDLWLPIVLSAIIVFIASSIMHMMLKYHRGDFKQVPNEGRVLDGLRKESIPPGNYAFPYCESSKQMGSPEMTEKYKKGPVGILTLLPNQPPAMPKFLVLWFVHCLVISFLVAYLASRTVDPGAEYLAVFRVTGTAGFLAYAGAESTNSIWRGQAWSTTIKNIFDGLVYALLTAGVFGWLWPA
jgi:hypothetical protein